MDPEELAARLVKRLRRDGLLPPSSDGHGLRQGLNDLNQRLRYAVGEYDSRPSPSPVP